MRLSPHFIKFPTQDEEKHPQESTEKASFYVKIILVYHLKFYPQTIVI